MADGVSVKICGLTRNADARDADESGADYLGIVLSEGFGRSVPASEAASVLRGTTARRVAVVVDEPAEAIAVLARAITASVIQLHGEESVELVEELRSMGDWTIWKAVRVDSMDDLVRAVAVYRDVVDGLLVEGWKEGVVGGAGVTVELDPASVRSAIPGHLEFILAGGLAPGTVGEAVARFVPDVVDVSSGVERAEGLKDPTLVTTFIQSARTVPRRPGSNSEGVPGPW
jgi:phosphoribosylanthranilate isomerase